MRFSSITTMTAILLATSVAIAQPPDRPRDGRGRPPFRGPQHYGGGPAMRQGPMHHGGVFALLDADGDGMLNPSEISGAPEAMARLDANQDGNITATEAARGAMQAQARSRNRGDAPAARRRPIDGKPGNAQRPDPAGKRRAPQDRQSTDPPFRPGGPGRFGSGDGTAPFAPRMGERIMRLDANEDGKLSAEELPEPLLRMMEEADSNDDGYVDSTELQAFGERMRQRRGERGAPRNRARQEQPQQPALESQALDAT